MFHLLVDLEPLEVEECVVKGTGVIVNEIWASQDDISAIDPLGILSKLTVASARATRLTVDGTSKVTACGK